MIYSVLGNLKAKKNEYIVVGTDCLSYKIYTSLSTLESLPSLGKKIEVITHLYVRENTMDLYGFLSQEELNLFEALINVSGVGPKSALNIMSIEKVDRLIAAINEGRVDLLSKASGIGKKIAQRIGLELKGKLSLFDSSETIGKMETDIDLEDTLIGLGYNRKNAKAAISTIDPKITDFNERLRAALKNKDSTK